MGVELARCLHHDIGRTDKQVMDYVGDRRLAASITAAPAMVTALGATRIDIAILYSLIDVTSLTICFS